MDRVKLIERLQSIAIMAVQAQSETDENLGDLLTDIDRDLRFAIAEFDKVAGE